MTLSLAHVTLDCADAATLAGFWSKALDRPVDAATLAGFWSKALDRPVDDGASEFFASIGMPASADRNAWLFLKVPEGKEAKNRMHLDLTAPDRAAEVARLVGLGATEVAEHDEYGTHWTVLQDPEGNEFCVASHG